ncbi:lasso peptide biosynthesis B2 protein [Sphingomonas sp.]|uniref:lasso peptide biosynthesis B2 protein n=1 Tax=Sphingomonas sp. TaxID=28214 RepID=UPI001B2210CC|nr:lasso peptide biosynthesis B2 protein [Sphingomonas sp.]MBO9714785.1 lasso peptide biosynthesis B2 protein [Sphingomonas sp.]
MAADRGLAVEAALGRFAAHALLRLLGFKRLVRTLGRGTGRPPDPLLVTRIAAAVNRNAKGGANSCLRRAFAAAWMLRMRGMMPRLHYGVRRWEGEMQAHAWLEVEGLPVVGYDQAPDFALLASFPPDNP